VLGKKGNQATDMYSRLNDVPVFESYPTQLDATHFNHVQYALNHLGDSIRLRIPRLKHLDLILEKQAWIIVDRVLNDIPIAAWTKFETKQRENLHQPIKCKLSLYHIHAHMILEHSIEAMELLLGEQLLELSPSNSASISNIQKEK
jgi:hypothetical protein